MPAPVREQLGITVKKPGKSKFKLRVEIGSFPQQGKVLQITTYIWSSGEPVHEIKDDYINVCFMNGTSEPLVLRSYVGDKRLAWKNPAVRGLSTVQLCHVP